MGYSTFGLRLWDPKGTNLMLIAFSRRLVVTVAAMTLICLLCVLASLLAKRKMPWLAVPLVLLMAAAAAYLLPPVLQFTREFVYFGESGISTNALLRALGFTLGLAACLLLCLSAFEVHQALGERGKPLFLFSSLLIFALEYGAGAVAALQRLKVIPLTDIVFQIMIFRDEYPNIFLFAQLALGLTMLLWVLMTHQRPQGEFATRAALRKEKARLRGCRRWAWSLLLWGGMAAFIVVVVRYYDTRPPAEVPLEPYAMEDGRIVISLEQVSDGHLHKFSYVTPGGFDVRFLAVKKPAGTAYGIGLDACDICGIAGYYERGDEVVCRRCDVVMNKNTIGFKGGCNPVPFDYEIRQSKIFIDPRELIQHEKRFK